MLEFKNELGKIMYCEEFDGGLYIDYISVNQKNKGHGTKLMKMFIKRIFKTHGYTNIGLIASADYGTTIEVLEHFYGKFGFKVVQENSFGKYMRMNK